MKNTLLFIFSLLTLSLCAQDIKFDALSNGGGRISNVNSASFSTGASVGTISGNNVDLTFTAEVTPPKEIIAYAYQANNSRYVITQLDGGGNNAIFYALGAGESAHSSNFGIGNQVTTDIMTAFGTAKLTLDISMANLDAVRNAGGFGQETKEAHAFIMFRF